MKALGEAEAWHRSMNRENDGRMLKEMKDIGLIIEENPDRAAFSKVVKKPLEEEYAKKFGWTMIERINQVQ